MVALCLRLAGIAPVLVSLVAGGCGGGGGGSGMQIQGLGTSVGATIDQDTVWGSEGSPYLIVGDVDVAASIRLTILPGVEVIFVGQSTDPPGPHLTVRGILKAVGSLELPIVFRAEAGGPRWGGLRFTPEARGAEFDQAGRFISGSVLEHCTFLDAGASALHAEGSAPRVRNCRFLDNTSLADKGEELRTREEATRRIKGGAIHYHRVTGRIAIESSHFLGNTAVGAGGGVAIVESGAAGLLIEGCTFERNEASFSVPDQLASVGGALYLLASGPAVVRHCTFLDNVADGGGGIHYSFYPNILVENCRFSDNVGRRTGGAIFASHRTRSIIRGCSFLRNRAEDEPPARGGAGGAVTVWANTDATIRDCLFLENEAERGGALAATRRADGFHRGSLVVEDNEIDGNSAASDSAYSLYLRGYSGIALRRNNIVRHRLRAVLTEADGQGLLILAEGNWWGSPLSGEIENSVLHVIDDPRRDSVDFLPFAASPF